MKIIGIPGWKITEESYGVTSNYLEFASKYGKPRIIMPWEDVVDVDLLILPGGRDISPVLYGETPGFKTSNPDVFKEHFYKTKLPLYIEANIPIFGICLGFQQLGIYFGNKLKQNTLFHAQSSDRWEKAHEVEVIDSSVEEIYGKIIEVNSHHHQYFESASFTDELVVVAVAENEDSDELRLNEGFIVEAFIHKEKPIAGVQWHPEELYDSISDKLINHIIK